MLMWGCGCNYDCNCIKERVKGRDWWCRLEKDVCERFNDCCLNEFTDKSDADECDMNW